MPDAMYGTAGFDAISLSKHFYFIGAPTQAHTMMTDDSENADDARPFTELNLPRLFLV